MTAVTDSVQDPNPTIHLATTATSAGGKNRFAEVWPPIMIGLGIVLTVAWVAGLFEVLTTLI
jgi:hypothetical protein